MSKKSFRKQPARDPSYPRLVDLQPGFLRRWGLVAAGGLLIGSGACKSPERTAGVVVQDHRSEERAELQARSQARTADRLDSGAPEPPVLPPPGEPPMARVESKTATQTTTADESDSAAGKKKAKKHQDRPRLRGRPPKPRIDP
jgi:hypothetical protein